MALSEDRRRKALEIINGPGAMQSPSSSRMSPERRQQALSIINSQSQPEDDESLIRQAAEGVAEGTIDIADLPQLIVKGIGNIMGDPFELTPGMKAAGIKPRELYKPNLPMASSKIKEYLKEKTGIGLDTQPTTGLGKTVRTMGRFAGSTLAGGALGAGSKAAGLPVIGKFLGEPSSAKELAKMTGLGTGIGAAVGASEALGAPPWLQTTIGVGAPFAIPATKAAAKGVKYVASPSYRKNVSDQAAKEMASSILKESVGSENIPTVLEELQNYQTPLPGYQPLTSEQTKNVGLAQLQRAQYGHTPSLGEQQARNDALIKQGLQSIEAAPETMSDVAQRTSPFTTGQELQGQLTKNIDKLKAEREAAHAPAKKAVEEYKPPVYTPKTYELIDKKLETAKGALKTQLERVKGFLTSNKAEKLYTKDIGPNAIQQAKEKAGHTPSAHELKETISEIGDMIDAAKISVGKNSKRAQALMEIKESLYEDLVNTPVKEANVIYSEKSKPISKIEEQFGAESKRDVYNKRYLMRQDKASDSIISKSMQNPEFAEGFNAQFSQHPESMKVTKGYINNDLHKKVINKNGKVDLDKLYSWKQSNPYAETIYPGITKKLDNLQKKGLIDKLNGYLKDEKNISYDKINKFITENEAMLNESFTADQLKILRGSELALSGRSAAETRAKAPGSPTTSNSELLKAIQQNVPAWILKQASKGTVAGQAGVWLYNFFRAAKKAKAEDLVNAALADKDVAKLLLTQVGDVKGLEKAANKLKDKSYIPRTIILNNKRKEDKENEQLQQ